MTGKDANGDAMKGHRHTEFLAWCKDDQPTRILVWRGSSAFNSDEQAAILLAAAHDVSWTAVGSDSDLEPDATDDTEVPAFITMQEPGEPWKGTAKELKRLSNPEVISWLVVFDTWVGNVDRYSVRTQHGELRPHRNDGNVFLSHRSEPKRLKIMTYDHTHCHFALISASAQTEIQGKIEDPAVYGHFPEFSKLINRDLVREAVAKLLEFTEAECLRIVETNPEEWLADPSTRARLAEFVIGRARYVADSIERKLFPQRELDL